MFITHRRVVLLLVGNEFSFLLHTPDSVAVTKNVDYFIFSHDFSMKFPHSFIFEVNKVLIVLTFNYCLIAVTY